MSAASPYATIACDGFGADELHLLDFSGHDELGRPFQYLARVSAANQAIDLDTFVGKMTTVNAPTPGGGPAGFPQAPVRYFHGLIIRAAFAGIAGRRATYELSIVPSLWKLTLNSNCRIFQKMSVPEIARKILKEDYGIAGHGYDDSGLVGMYKKKDFVVQYRETDFNFISRLFEQEGIYYYFKHSNSDHQMLVVDSPDGHRPVAGLDKVAFFAPGDSRVGTGDHIRQWHVSSQAASDRYAHTDFDFKKPRVLLEKFDKLGKWQPRGEIFDYPGDFIYDDDSVSESEESARYARIRRQELQALRAVVHAASNSISLFPGAVFNFVPDPRDTRQMDAKKYLIYACHYTITGQESDSTTQLGNVDSWGSSLQLIEHAVPFRPARQTSKPIIAGPQTALVVGKKGEDIDTDQFGRVKLRFHWDRDSSGDENSSCWVRVAQIWAGKKWGGIHLPRIGQEVIVEFLEGDPDRPIVTGRVYNGDNMPPYNLPANKTQSGVKSRSSKDGGVADFNELRFEDKAGSEEVYLHAQKDMNTVVEHDDIAKINNDQKITIESGNHALAISAGKSEVEAKQSILLKVGQSSVFIDNSGVTIKGLQIVIQGSTMIDAKAPNTTIKGDAMVTIQGGIVKIN